MSDIAIRVEGLGKQYKIGKAKARYGSFRESITDTLSSPFKRFRNGNGQNGSTHNSSPITLHSESCDSMIWALRDVSFEVKRGEVVGVIGRNGAGKSTLLKVLSRITEPTTGAVDIYGRVGSLLEVGTGFHPELSGRENIYLNGSIIGMKRAEIQKKFEEIVAFAEIEKFLDTPVKHYSSGMYVRLAFAVAAHLEPEILLVDEVLAVGDVQFQKKCLGKMSGIARNGRTVLFVSHNMHAIRQLCTRALFLETGHTKQQGSAEEIVQAYLHDAPPSKSIAPIGDLIAGLPEDPVFKLRGVEIEQEGRRDNQLLSGQPIEIIVEYDVLQMVSGLHVYFQLYDIEGTLLFESIHNGDEDDVATFTPAKYVSKAIIPADFLANRTYEIRIHAGIHNVRNCIPKSSPVSIRLNVTGVGRLNRAYPGYISPGRIAPLIPWSTTAIKATSL